MAQKTTVERRHAWKGAGVAWVYEEPGLYVARVRGSRWELERRVRNPFAGIEVTGWRLVRPGAGGSGEFVGPSMAPAVDRASSLVNEHYEKRKREAGGVA
ncbi:hypothetical protein ABZT26_35150 [Streptomyces sp. NPDC005395]|uniref:hypothetical protein n=1 Tax=Streptomyces sp. NPDC005395 TaxID=3157042 RepID=UPI0033BE5A2C